MYIRITFYINPYLAVQYSTGIYQRLKNMKLNVPEKPHIVRQD
jgi:hypothetical protein